MPKNLHILNIIAIIPIKLKDIALPTIKPISSPKISLICPINILNVSLTTSIIAITCHSKYGQIYPYRDIESFHKLFLLFHPVCFCDYKVIHYSQVLVQSTVVNSRLKPSVHIYKCLLMLFCRILHLSN